MSEKYKLEWIEEFRCSRCGAPLDPSPDTLLIVCKYCGYPNPVVGNIGYGNVYVVPSRFDDDSIVKHVEKKIGSGVIVEVRGYYLPYWVFKVYYKARVSYQSALKREVEKKVSGELTEYVFGRKHIDYQGIEELYEHYIKTSPEKKLMSESKIEEWFKKGMEVLSVDIDYSVVENLVEHKVVSTILRKEKTLRRVRVENIDLKFNIVSKPVLVYLPVWYISFRRGGATYNLVVAGWDGEIVYGIHSISSKDILVDSFKLLGLIIAINLYLVLMYSNPVVLSILIEQYRLYGLVTAMIIALTILFYVFAKVWGAISAFITPLFTPAVGATGFRIRHIRYSSIYGVYSSEDTGPLGLPLSLSGGVLLAKIVIAIVNAIYFIAAIVMYLLPLIASLAVFIFTSTIFTYLTHQLLAKSNRLFNLVREYRR